MKAHAQFVNVPNNEEGRLFRMLVRKYLNPNMEARTRGLSKHRKAKAEHAGITLNRTGDIPIKLADRWHIYIDQKYVKGVDRSKLDCRGPGKWYYKQTYRKNGFFLSRYIGPFSSATAAATAYTVAHGTKET